jgi:hypothetical protein
MDDKNDLTKFTRLGLLSKCKELGITNYSTKNKLELIKLIETKTTNTNTTNNTSNNTTSNNNTTNNNNTLSETTLVQSVEQPPTTQPPTTQPPLTTQSNKSLLLELQQKYSLKELATKLNLAIGTIQRWIELDNIPYHYTFDLLRLLSKNIDYSIYKSSQKDQFFTPDTTAKQCWDKFCDITKIKINEYIFIEPSAGDSSFLKCLPANSIGLDIEPRHSNILKQDYLLWQPPVTNNNNTITKYSVIGNPPFGLRGHTALNFINHSFEFADYVAFILPQLFESDGKGSPRKRVKGYNLIYSEKINGFYHTPENTNVDINGVFQIWSKYSSNTNFTIKTNDNENIKVYSLSDGGSVATTRNKKMLDKCDIYLPSTCFGKETMKLYSTFKELPNMKGYGVVFLNDKNTMIEKSKNINWGDIAFLSTNSAYNLRTSLILDALTQL